MADATLDATVFGAQPIIAIHEVGAVAIAVTRIGDMVVEDALTGGLVLFELLRVASGRILLHCLFTIGVVAEEDVLAVLEKASTPTTKPMAVEALLVPRVRDVANFEVNTALIAVTDDIGTATQLQLLDVLVHTNPAPRLVAICHEHVALDERIEKCPKRYFIQPIDVELLLGVLLHLSGHHPPGHVVAMILSQTNDLQNDSSHEWLLTVKGAEPNSLNITIIPDINRISN